MKANNLYHLLSGHVVHNADRYRLCLYKINSALLLFFIVLRGPCALPYSCAPA